MKLSKSGVRFSVFLITALGFIGTVAALLFIEVPIASADILKVLVGFLGGAFTTAVAFYFGDSDSRGA